MAGVVELADPKSISRGVVLNFPANDDEDPSSLNSLKTPPRRLRRRLLSEPKTPLSAEHIEAKLREADLRRQQFYDSLASKARPKSRNSPDTNSQEADRRQRLEARLDAAQQKRLGILNSAQMRLARLDELRKVAKRGAERRFEEELKVLSSNIELRLKRAEAKRIHLLKAHKQKRAAKSEQAIRSLRQKMCKKDKYRETLHEAIYHKHVVAKRNRHGLLVEKKMRAHLTALQVQQIARSVYSQQETRKKDQKDQIACQLKKAKRKREEHLKRCRSLKSHPPADLKIVDKQEYSSRKIARHWRHFVKSRQTTLSLAKAFVSLGINEHSVKLMPFEQLALLMKSEKTVSIVKALMDRLESRLKLSLAARNKLCNLANIDDLLRHLASPHCNRISGSGTQKNGSSDIVTTKSVEKEAWTSEKFSRYPTKAVLSAYMTMGHQDAVLDTQGACENVLSESAVSFIRQFELLINRIIDGPIQTSLEEVAPEIPKQKSIRSLLEAYDEAWCSYLHNLVTWKLKDAKLLEEELVRAACQLELSIIQASKKTSVDDGGLSHGLEAIKNKVLEEQKLLREQVLHVSGNAGVELMERAVADIRLKFGEGKECGSPYRASTVHVSPSSLPGRLELGTNHLAEGCQVPSSASASCSSSDIDNSSSSKGTNFFTPNSISSNCLSSDRMKVTENELLVNEIIHTHHQEFADSLNAMAKDRYLVKEKVRETMEKAFWDCVMESVQQDEPDFSWILKLMKEVRDELCEMSPQNWRQEIMETIDVDYVSQMLESGTLDIYCLGKNLAFALSILEKLSAPVNDEEIKSSHAKLLRELGEISKSGDISNASFSVKVIKGLRFVLEEIQALKKEISKARVKFVEPLIKGPAGVEYLQKCFTNRYGSPVNAQSSLKLTSQWLSSVLPLAEDEWNQYRDSLSAVPSNSESPQVLPTTLRTGGSFSSVLEHMYPVTGSNQLECNGEQLDKLVRLGLLKLASGVKGLTQESLPETLELNLSRLRAVQSQYQETIVISTCMLILRQMLVSDKLLNTASNMENIVTECHNKLSLLLDSGQDIGISELVGSIFGVLKGHGHTIDAEKLEGKEKGMESMIGKSLQGEDAVFKRVSHCVYVAFRGAVFGGIGYKGRQLVVSVLRRIGAVFLADRVLKSAEVLVGMAKVSCTVHKLWYEELLKHV